MATRDDHRTSAQARPPLVAAHAAEDGTRQRLCWWWSLMPRKQWWAASVHLFDGDLGCDLRDRFGPVGLCMWVGFLAACKRSISPGKISYSSDGECLSLMGLPGLKLVDEDGEPFTLEDFWTFLGHRKQTSRTTRRRLVYVTATRWEQWQNDGKRQKEAERKQRVREQSESNGTAPEQLSDSPGTALGQPSDADATDIEAERKSRSRAESERTVNGHEPDRNRTDSDRDSESYRESDNYISARARTPLRAVAIGGFA